MCQNSFYSCRLSYKLAEAEPSFEMKVGNKKNSVQSTLQLCQDQEGAQLECL